MQTIEEYKEYTKQLEGEVKQWHDAFDASQAQVKVLTKENLRLESERVEQNSIIETCANELEELRKHEVEWDLSKTRIKELMGDKAQLEETVAVLQLNAKNKSAKDEEINAVHQKSLARLEELVNKKYTDNEEDHVDADEILCDMLNALGYKDLTDAWDNIGKWYS